MRKFLSGLSTQGLEDLSDLVAIVAQKIHCAWLWIILITQGVPVNRSNIDLWNVIDLVNHLVYISITHDRVKAHTMAKNA